MTVAEWWGRTCSAVQTARLAAPFQAVCCILPSKSEPMDRLRKGCVLAWLRGWRELHVFVWLMGLQGECAVSGCSVLAHFCRDMLRNREGTSQYNIYIHTEREREGG